jgi:hypothetical protein
MEDGGVRIGGMPVVLSWRYSRRNRFEETSEEYLSRRRAAVGRAFLLSVALQARRQFPTCCVTLPPTRMYSTLSDQPMALSPLTKEGRTPHPLFPFNAWSRFTRRVDGGYLTFLLFLNVTAVACLLLLPAFAYRSLASLLTVLACAGGVLIFIIAASVMPACISTVSEVGGMFSMFLLGGWFVLVSVLFWLFVADNAAAARMPRRHLSRRLPCAVWTGGLNRLLPSVPAWQQPCSDACSGATTALLPASTLFALLCLLHHTCACSCCRFSFSSAMPCTSACPALAGGLCGKSAGSSEK